MADATGDLTRRLRHLVRRFFEVLAARRPTPAEQLEAAALLRPAEAALFWDQPVADQRHGLESARTVAARLPDRPDLIRAALLHDVGKRHARLGVVGRSVASALELAHLPAPGRFHRYLAHGPLGAAELERAGAEEIVVAFAAAHHDRRPPQIDPVDWQILADADAV
jgi:putative nucleotidyltransferase with HDIG domain